MRKPAKGEVEIEIDDYVFIRETEDAILIKDFYVQDCPIEKWIPKSQILDGSDNPATKMPNEPIYLVLPEWLAIEKELV